MKKISLQTNLLEKYEQVITDYLKAEESGTVAEAFSRSIIMGDVGGEVQRDLNLSPKETRAFYEKIRTEYLSRR